MTVRIQDIAEQAGVSRGTVDRALHKRGRIRPEVADRIWAIARELGYEPRESSEKGRKHLKIGVVTQLAGSSFMIRINQGIEDAARLLGQQIGLHPAVMLISIYGGFFLYGLPGFFLGPFSVLVFQNVMKEVNCCMEKKRNAKG